MLRVRATGIIGASLAVALLGCPPQDQGSGRADDDVLTAAEVIGVARAINAGELDTANAVRGQLPRGAAGGMIDMIVEDHTRSLQELERISVQLSLVPEESELSRDLQQDVQDAMQSFADEQGAELGEEFIDVQVELHEKALKVIDDELLPATTEPTLMEYLGELRATIVHHLETARSLKDDDVREHRGTVEPAGPRQDGTQSQTGEPSGHMEGRPAGQGGRDTGGGTNGGGPR